MSKIGFRPHGVRVRSGGDTGTRCLVCCHRRGAQVHVGAGPGLHYVRDPEGFPKEGTREPGLAGKLRGRVWRFQGVGSGE